MANEKRLIDANALIAKFPVIGQFEKDLWHSVTIRAAIDDTPTVEAVEVKHGRWHDNPGVFGYICSQCNKVIVPEYFDGVMNYCPNCGAVMRERM